MMLSVAAAFDAAAGQARILALAGAVLPSFGLYRPAAAQKPYELPQCKEDAKGKVYIVLERTVLGLPPSNPNGGIGQAVPKEAMLLSPDPAEPEGCPNNPAQIQSHGLAGFLPLTRDPPGQSMQGVWATQSGLRLWSTGVFPKSPPNYPDMEATFSNVELVEGRCAPTNPDRSESDGVETCLVRLEASSPPNWKLPEHRDRSYRVSPTRYGTPRGRPFMFTCSLMAGQPTNPPFARWVMCWQQGNSLHTGSFRLRAAILRASRTT